LNLFRRFIRYLALDQITEAHAKGYMECAAISELAKRVAYAEGECAGRISAMAEIDSVVAARTMGMGDVVMPEDLARAKKGMVH
jgi:hypothetical protein